MTLPLFLAAIFSAPPVERTQDPAPANAPAITVRGELVTPEGQPLAGATVYLRAKTGGRQYHMGVVHNRDVLARTKSDEQGAFAFDSVAIPPRLADNIESLLRGNGGAEIVALAEGRSLAWADVPQLAPSAKVKLTLPPESPVVGQVKGDDGQPIADVQVRILGLSQATNDIDSFFSAPRDLNLIVSEIAVTARTDASGCFALPHVPRDIRLSVSWERSGRTRLWGVVDTGSPGAPAEVKFTSGGSATVPRWRSPLEIVLKSRSDVLVRVSDHRGLPVSTGTIQAIGSQRTTFASAALDERGEAHIPRGQLGEYSFHFRGDPLTPVLGTRVTAEIKDDAAPVVEIKLPAPRWLEGRVVDAETGTGICGAYINYSLTAERGPGASSASSSAVSGLSGEFRIPVAVGKGRLTFQHELYGYLAPTYGVLPNREKPVPGKAIDIAESGSTLPTTLKLSRGLMIRGRLLGTDGKPVAGATVRAQNSDQPYITRWATTGVTGQYELSGLSPFVGTLVTATADNGGSYAQIAAQPDQPWEQTRVVEMPLELHAGVALVGRVVFAGKGRSGVRLKLSRSIGAEKNSYHALGEYVTDAQGRFRVAGLDAGDHYRFEIVDPDGLAAPEWEYQGGYIHTVPDGTTEVTLSDAVLVRRGQNLRGIVVDPRGRPAPGVSVSARLANGSQLSRTGNGPPPWTKTGADGRFELTNLPDQSIELMAYLANPKGGRILFPAKLQTMKGQQDIRILLDPELTNEVEDLDAPRK